MSPPPASSATNLSGSSCRLRPDGPRLLVLADTFFPGWEARVDGRLVPIWEANVAHRAVLVPEGGRHTVEFTYRSRPFEAGRVVSLAAAAVGLIALAAIRFRRGGVE